MTLLNKSSKSLIISTIFLAVLSANAQQNSSQTIIGGDIRTITTAIPFINIVPESRGGALGDAGVAISPTNNDMFWNVGKLARNEKDYGVSLSYNPWLRRLVQDMSLNYLSGFYKTKKEEAFGASLTYFDLGKIEFTNDQGFSQGTFNPREYAFAVAYSRVLSKNLSLGVGLKYIHSNLTNGINDTRPANTAAGDVGLYYTKPVLVKNTNNVFSFGATIQNVGGKVAYTNSGRRDFLPGNLRVGAAWTHEIDFYNKLTFTLDANKLLVPSPKVVKLKDKSGNDSIRTIVEDKPLMSGIFGSFADASGGLREELQEVILGGGIEYWYNNTFAVRGGYFHESKLKGNRRYITLGVGLVYKAASFDFAYLIGQGTNNALGETLRFTLGFYFEKPKTEDDSIQD
ncbi:MAG: type IX secretion system outer membrane channel protein PorV [Cytophagales bacterium]